MYKIAAQQGDAVQVPRLLFSRLGRVSGGDEKREGLFQVGLYMIEKGQATADEAARALRLPLESIEAALHYWEGAGLLEPQEAQAPPPLQKRRRMTTREVVAAGQESPGLAALLAELQRLFGAVIGESDLNLYVTLHLQDGFAADLILLAASESLANGAKSARYVEKVLFTWRESGICDCAGADAYLQAQALRARRAQELAERMGLAGDPFSFADKKKIAAWFEEYGYGFDMIDAARLVAGDKGGEIRYLHGVLKRWHGKGYTKPRELSQGGEGRNLRAHRAAPAPKEDLLQVASRRAGAAPHAAEGEGR